MPKEIIARVNRPRQKNNNNNIIHAQRAESCDHN